jgi:hypothetical protein
MRIAASDCHGRLRAAMFFDKRRDDDRLDLMEADSTFVAPGEKSARSPRVGTARVRVADVGSEKLEESLRRTLAGIGD